ncbi:16S rRNA (guanine(527)-N(7))-methyltransferase RsmG [Halorhodospira halochloris]|uniref:16S rRNA (guanine(527)-N(7))-methyltransferase RsmG n=1 Tax=Halorhodospira halochloris TaxID=1052 RepID=UPI001EE7A8B8|nr:16S rRNA (guanine(527)-N(7))-methyltransferase RsmG [Halorhodospira halochloris]MCG5530278.1 16S rRNA (guanine(527)-N(7))-methyltransferase RsmG [Halorhodospira halochloris]
MPVKDLLIDSLNQTGLDIEEAHIESLVQYIQLLEKWNKAFNLTAADQVHELVDRHVVDSLTLGCFLPNEGVVADVGSGAGLPGIPLAITHPMLTVELIDSNGKKTRFMQHATLELGLKNTFIMRQRMEDLQESSYDVITARAVASLKVLIQRADRLLKPGGELLAQKGAKADDEIAEVNSDWGEMLCSRRLPVVNDSGRSTLIRYKKSYV